MPINTARSGRPSLPDYVIDRLRRRVPTECFIVPQSTPVPAFGDPTLAGMATLGLNPSRIEFLGSDGLELIEDKRRLESLTSLGVTGLQDAPLEKLAAIVNGCNRYFQRNPYRWFNPLDEILRACGASYFDGTACHLDLVQWATDPTWAKLWDGVQDRLIREDGGFLMRQLECESIRVLLLNGRRVIKEFERVANIDLQELPFKVMDKTRLFSGRGPKHMLVVGWSINLQSSFGVSLKLRAELADVVAQLVKLKM